MRKKNQPATEIAEAPKPTDSEVSVESGAWTDTRGIAKHTGLSVPFFHQDRVTHLTGIPYVKLRKRVLYHIPTVDAFLKKHMVNNSGQ